ncbi:MAG: hypothetical protein ACXACG_04090 [Candidatus Thorarchaeota archaeon]|jgi:hypothetical protein
MNSRKLAILSVFLALVFIQATPVSAHPPGPMTLDYDFSSQIFTVQITHSVTDVNSHFIAQVRIEKNSVEVLTRTYSSQNTTSGFSATYAIAAEHGDVLSVRADCSISGTTIGDISLIDPSVPTTTASGLPMEMIIAVAIIAIGAVAVVFALMRRR